ncbi:MAG: response regulator [Candidatus Poribacteria bacterium]|nr:response regulator [Candidatus Poribacteria bacterium]
MRDMGKPTVILYAEDDEEDRLLTERALRRAKLTNRLVMVEDGEELVSYLQREGKYADRNEYPLPGLILLDLNMPRMDGREALTIIKSNAEWRAIPTIVLTTSAAEEDILRSYDIGANSYIQKPVTFERLVDVVRNFSHYWFQIVELPPVEES